MLEQLFCWTSLTFYISIRHTTDVALLLGLHTTTGSCPVTSNHPLQKTRTTPYEYAPWEWKAIPGISRSSSTDVHISADKLRIVAEIVRTFLRRSGAFQRLFQQWDSSDYNPADGKQLFQQWDFAVQIWRSHCSKSWFSYVTWEYDYIGNFGLSISKIY